MPTPAEAAILDLLSEQKYNFVVDHSINIHVQFVKKAL